MKLLNSLRFKLVLLFLCVAIIPLTGIALFQLSQFDKTVAKSIRTQEMEISRLNADRVNYWIGSKVSQLTETLKAHPEFADMKNIEIHDFLELVRESDPELETFTAIDKDGNAISVVDKSVINLSDREYFIQAKETRSTSFSDIVVSRATGNRCITIAVPIIKDNTFHGALFSMVNVQTLENAIGNIKVGETGYAYLLSPKGDFVFHPDPEKIGKNFAEYAKNPETLSTFQTEVLTNDSGFITYVDDNDVQKVGAYSTISHTGWKLVVNAPSREVYAEANRLKTIAVIFILAVALLIIVISVLMAGSVARPVIAAAGHLDVLANADFSREVPEKFLRRKDELGLLAKSVNTMSRSVRSVLHDVVAETNGVKENVTVSSQNLADLVSEIEDISATTQEMSAGMEETAASTQQMNATSEEIESAVESIAAKAQNGSAIAGEISKRAQDLKESAVKSQETAHNIHQEIDADIRTSIEQSKAVEQINVLTESILQITSQTNLLALNAAIEAARAGEAGKGFSVVAEEIRKLAEDSKNTVNQIQKVTNLVITSVQNLIQSSEKALNFIDTTVINDHNALVNTGEQYYKDADAIQEMVTDFSATSEQLLASIQNMVRAINEVTVSNNEGAQGTQNIAEKASNIMQKAAKIADLMKETELSSRKLNEAVSKFTI
jgi:methyl-accepting chemotaxis protein